MVPRSVQRPTTQPADMMFYVEQVQHEFIQNERATTMLGLTRGLLASDDAEYGSLLTQEAAQLSAPGDDVRQFYKDIIIRGQAQPNSCCTCSI